MAIHRGLVQDETESFDADSFDAKWKSKNSDEVQEVAKKSTTKVIVTVPEGVPSSKSKKVSEDVVEKATEIKTEDMAIEDEEFLKELESMEG